MAVAATTPGRPKAPVPKSGIRAWAARYPVTAFLGILFTIGYPVMALPVLADHGIIPGGWMPAVLGLDAERFASVLLIFVALIPALVAVTWAAEGPAGLRSLARRMVQWRFGAAWWALVLAGLPALTIAFAVLLGGALRPVVAASLVVDQLTGFLAGFLLVNLWEEAGWAGLVQTRLERKHSFVVAALVTAVPFALIHLPLHFIGDFSPGSLIASLVILLIVCAVIRLLIGVFLRGTNHSVLAVALLHTVFNKSNNDDGIVAVLVEGDARGLAALLATIVLAVAAVFLARRQPA